MMTELCPYCFEPTTNLAPDAIAYCRDCEAIVEGHTVTRLDLIEQKLDKLEELMRPQAWRTLLKGWNPSVAFTTLNCATWLHWKLKICAGRSLFTKNTHVTLVKFSGSWMKRKAAEIQIFTYGVITGAMFVLLVMQVVI